MSEGAFSDIAALFYFILFFFFLNTYCNFRAATGKLYTYILMIVCKPAGFCWNALSFHWSTRFPPRIYPKISDKQT